ncbi:alpha/beta fold hydrolase, partial [Saccharothrix sp. MB29]|nr:alpha/beta fold hydrolase [Saccharothrix sp. MB29]
EAVGEGVDPALLGTRVAIPWLGHACGECSYCVSGWETLCEQQRNTGYSVDGCYAEHTLADARYTVPVPDAVSSTDAAPLTCAGVTTYKAVKVAGVRSAERVAVFGIGGLGHLALQYARVAGGFTVAVDVEDDKLALARELGADHTVRTVFEAPTVAALADRLTRDDEAASFAPVLPLRPTGTRPPLFCVHPGAGVSWCYAGLLAHLGSDQPVYGVQARGLDGEGPLPTSVAEMAADYAARIRAVRPEGPYRLLGWSFGAHVAHAVAALLGADLLVVVDAFPPSDAAPDGTPAEVEARLMRAAGIEPGPDGRFPVDRYKQFLQRENVGLGTLGEAELAAMKDVYVNNTLLMRRARPGRFGGDLVIFTADRAVPTEDNPRDPESWRPHVAGRIVRHRVDADHEGMLTKPEAVARIGRALAIELQGER